MKTVRTLIDLARAKVHTDRELAEKIGETPQNLAHIKAGRRTISPETVAALCDVLELPGEEAREWIAVAILENPKNASKLDLLKRALFACWVLGVGALSSTSNDAMATVAGDSTTTSIEHLRPQAVTGSEPTLYTLSRMAWSLGFGFFGWLRGLAAALRLPAPRPAFPA